MKTAERMKIEKENMEKHGTEAKKIRWKIITVETKEHPEKPKALITGEVACIYPTGDIAFHKITRMQLWDMEKNTILEVTIPEIYQNAKKICIKREIIATLLYIEEAEVVDDKKDG